MSVIEEVFPEFYRRADAESVRWQARYLWSERVQLVALVITTGIAALNGPPGSVVLFFGLALVAQIYRLVLRADEKWWNGRAGAESTKTASWLFVVGGEPFDKGNAQADLEFSARITAVAKDVARLIPVPTGDAHVTAEMRSVRARPLSERIRVYQHDRIRGQCNWYASKSDFNRKRSTAWSSAGVAASGLALGFGIAAAVYDWSLDAVGLFAAAGASIAAWIAVKQYQVLARSYAVASAELSEIDVQIQSRENWTESEWASFVNAAEEAISREHTSWRASRAV